MTVRVIVVGWETGFEKIKFTHLLMDRTGMSLADAKHATDRLLGGNPIQLDFDSQLSSSNFCASALLLGAVIADDR
jgi:hypothetical protein